MDLSSLISDQSHKVLVTHKLRRICKVFKISKFPKNTLTVTNYRVRQLIQSMDKFACFGLYTEFETTKSHIGISLTLEDKIKSGNF